MSSFQKGATICIVNYKTELLTRLCLRSIRKFTKPPYKLIAVDNNSGDASLEYLRSLSWIKLIERNGEEIRSGSWAHGSGLDRGLAECDTEYFIAMHSDIVVRHNGWLDLLTAPADSDPAIACVGSGKLEDRPDWLESLRRATDLKRFFRKIGGGQDMDSFYIRAICALYRTECLKSLKLSFSDGTDKGVTCGKKLYFDLLQSGAETLQISSSKMKDALWHLAHATMVLNPEFKVRKRTEEKCRKKLAKLMDSQLIKDLSNDTSLDK